MLLRFEHVSVREICRESCKEAGGQRAGLLSAGKCGKEKDVLRVLCCGERGLAPRVVRADVLLQLLVVTLQRCDFAVQLDDLEVAACNYSSHFHVFVEAFDLRG